MPASDLIARGLARLIAVVGPTGSLFGGVMNVPQSEQQPALRRVVVGEANSATVPYRWVGDLAFLTCYVANPVVSVCGLPANTTTPHTYNVAYKKSPGTRVLRITVEANVAVAGTRPSLTVAVTSTGTVNWVETGGALYLDGSQNIVSETSLLRDYSATINHLDVSALTDGTFYDLTFTVTDTSAGASRGLYAIHVVEVPLADTDPVTAPTTDPGANPGWLQSSDRNRVVDGTTSLSYGMERVAQQFEAARYQRRRHLQHVWPEDLTNAKDVTSAVVGADFPFGYVTNPKYRLRGRALYGTATASNMRIRARYIMDGLQTCTLRVAVTPVGGATTNTDIVLANSAVWTKQEATFTVPCTGTTQEADVKFYAWNSVAAKNTRISQLCIVDDES